MVMGGKKVRGNGYSRRAGRRRDHRDKKKVKERRDVKEARWRRERGRYGRN